MQAKKRIFLLTFFISALSLGGAVQFFILYHFQQIPVATLLFNLSIGVFSSSLLGCSMSLTEYFVLRKENMEFFMEEAERAVAVVKEVQYFDIDAPVELVQACFGEIQTQKTILTTDGVKQQKLCDWYLSTLPDSVQARFTHDWSWEAWYQEKMEEYDLRLIGCFQSVIDLSEMDLTNLHKAYGRFDFFSNKRVREKLITPIYNAIVEANALANERAVDFKRCMSVVNGNKYVNIWFLMQAYDLWFEEETQELHDQLKVAVYFKLYDDLAQNLATYRAKVYDQKEPEHKPHPIFTTYRKVEKVLEKKV
ncbi:MAG: hypothetical protein R3Y07_08445 [Eubacteriales bacterium]